MYKIDYKPVSHKSQQTQVQPELQLACPSFSSSLSSVIAEQKELKLSK